MKNNSKKHEAFSLIEIVISIMILVIISVSVYSGFIMIIKQTKMGQVKQTSALEGKKIIEEIQAAIEDNSFKVSNDVLLIGTKKIQKQQDSNNVYTRYLDANYEECNKEVCSYVEEITVTPTKVITNINTEKTIGLDTSYETEANKIYISKIGAKDYIAYWKEHDSAYSPNTSNSTEIPSASVSGSTLKKIVIYVYLEPVANDLNNEDVIIKDYTGQLLLSTTKAVEENFVMNFSKYKDSLGSLVNNVEIEINMYNKTKKVSNVYIEKQKELNVNVEPRSGGINIYDNRTEDLQQGNVGELYDIKVEINKDNQNLFTGYSKKNIHK